MEFTKMQAAGNDFVLIDGLEKKYEYSQLAKVLCDRRFGVGGDGLMSCEKSDRADIKMVYYNSDGSEAKMCGNGIRCFSKFVYDNGIVKKEKFSVETGAGIKTVQLYLDEERRVEKIKVDMGRPIYEPKKIPVAIEKDKIINEILSLENEEIIFSTVLVGVPHTIIFVDDLETIDVNALGETIEKNLLFPERTNVNFIEIIDREKIKIKTWERGAGRTLACGTGSCASVVIGHEIGKLSEEVSVLTEGGEIKVCLKNGEIFLEGTATTVFKGVI